MESDQLARGNSVAAQDVITIGASGAAIWSVGDRPAMGPPKNQKGVRVWTGTRLIELESHIWSNKRPDAGDLMHGAVNPRRP